jgi:hypothetical protein
VAEEVHCTKESQGHGGAAEAVGKKFVTRQSRYKKIAALDLPQEFPEGWNGTCTNDMFDIAADARKKAGYHRPGKGKICTAMICRLTTRTSLSIFCSPKLKEEGLPLFCVRRWTWQLTRECARCSAHTGAARFLPGLKHTGKPLPFPFPLLVQALRTKVIGYYYYYYYNPIIDLTDHRST